MSSLEKVSPGMRPRFLSQKMAANDPEKKIPSTVANATRRSAKDLLDEIQRRAQLAFFWIHGMVLMAENRCVFLAGSLMYVSMSSEYISEWMFSIMIWNP